MKPSTMSSDNIAYGYGAGSSNQQPYRSQEWNHVQTRRINWRKSAPRKALDFSGCTPARKVSMAIGFKTGQRC